jgi:PAS domain S-box-containing protein
MSNSPPVTVPRAFGLRTRLIALVLAAVAPFVLLIGMVARQHRFNERANAEQTALDQASVLADKLDSRFGSVETVLLSLAHSVSPNPGDSLRNDKLLRDVAKELPKEFAHFAAITSGGRAIGTSDTFPMGKRRPIPLSSVSGDTLLGFDIQGPARLYGAEGPLALAIAREDTSAGIRVIGLVTIARLQWELSRTAMPSGAILTIMDPRGKVIFRSREPSTWLGKDVSKTAFFEASRAKRSGTAAVTDIDGVEVFSGFVAARHVPWTVQVGSPQLLAFAKERDDFWRAIGFGTLALMIAIILAWTQATRIIVPMRTVARDAALLSKGDLSHRSSLAARQDEIGVLSSTLNAMAEALEKREDALRKSELRFRAIIENVDDMITIVGEDGTRHYVSPAMSRNLGYSQEELLATTAQDMIHPSDWPAARELLRTVRLSPGTTVSGQVRYRHKDGSWRIFDAALSNLLDVPGVEGIVVNTRDITEQAALEGELRQAQKMESVGQLAGGVAHDFNNLLTVITGRIDFLIGAPNLDEEQESDLAEIKKAAERAAELTRQLLAFSRKQLLQPRVLDLNRTLDEFEPMLRRLIGEDIRIRIEHGHELGCVSADPGQLQQVLLNLALNARDAMPAGGVITFRTANEITGNGSGSPPIPVEPGEYVMLEVTDTGLGMDSATQARIFEPFFTTKGQGKGTGLGLSTVYGIVKQSGGGISVASNPGAGTIFRVFFPRTAGFALAETSQGPEDQSLSGTETILLVEDESSVRNLVERVLKARGYVVLAAENGGDAIRLASDPAQGVDMVLTDIVMPEMNGRELVEALHAKRPALRVLYMSGYTDDEIVRRGLNDPGMSFIQKPFTADNLAMQIRKLLDTA